MLCSHCRTNAGNDGNDVDVHAKDDHIFDIPHVKEHKKAKVVKSSPDPYAGNILKIKQPFVQIKVGENNIFVPRSSLNLMWGAIEMCEVASDETKTKLKEYIKNKTTLLWDTTMREVYTREEEDEDHVHTSVKRKRSVGEKQDISDSDIFNRIANHQNKLLILAVVVGIFASCSSIFPTCDTSLIDTVYNHMIKPFKNVQEQIKKDVQPIKKAIEELVKKNENYSAAWDHYQKIWKSTEDGTKNGKRNYPQLDENDIYFDMCNNPKLGKHGDMLDANSDFNRLMGKTASFKNMHKWLGEMKTKLTGEYNGVCRYIRSGRTDPVEFNGMLNESMHIMTILWGFSVLVTEYCKLMGINSTSNYLVGTFQPLFKNLLPAQVPDDILRSHTFEMFKSIVRTLFNSENKINSDKVSSMASIGCFLCFDVWNLLRTKNNKDDAIKRPRKTGTITGIVASFSMSLFGNGYFSYIIPMEYGMWGTLAGVGVAGAYTMYKNRENKLLSLLNFTSSFNRSYSMAHIFSEFGVTNDLFRNTSTGLGISVYNNLNMLSWITLGFNWGSDALQKLFNFVKNGESNEETLEGESNEETLEDIRKYIEEKQPPPPSNSSSSSSSSSRKVPPPQPVRRSSRIREKQPVKKSFFDI